MVRCAPVFVCLVALLALASSADAQYFGRNKVHYDRLEFRVIQTEHFDIYYYPEEARATQHVARMAERWYARFAEVLHHGFTRRQPLVLYASHTHFAQTNVTAASPSEGTGGLTERSKARIAMPFAAGLGATDHVLGHEIAHAFQIDIAKRAGQDAFALPGWVVEGMAEYLSLGGEDAHTAMWLRDAAAHDQLPTVEQLGQARFFPYRYGQAFWSFLAARYGDDVLGRILRSKIRGVLPRLEDATGLTRTELTRAWHASMSHDAADATVAPAQRNAMPGDRARLHVAPALSPDGRRLVFMSERDRVSLTLFMADAATGKILSRLVSTATDPHFDSLQYIQSSGAWDSAGTRFATAAVSGGRPVLLIVDTSRPEARREIPFDHLGEISSPSWSPDGTRLVFSAMSGGLSDLFVYTLSTGALQQLTADVYADLHPAWSPDGRSIALATDRFTSIVDDLRFGPLRVGILDLGSGQIRQVLSDAADAKQVSPQWSPAGDAMYFVSDRDGISNVYRVELSSGELRRVTNVRGGVSGITATSPALGVASRAGTLAFSVYDAGRYEIELLDETAALAGPVIDLGDVDDLPRRAGPTGTLERLLADSTAGLVESGEFSSTAYDDRLRLESVNPPFIGAGTNAGFGGILRASFGATFADTLRDRQLHMEARVGSDVDDLALQVAYMNRKGQWNWGVAGGFVPSRFVGARRAIARVEELITRETAHLRYAQESVKMAAHYHLNRTQRFELSAGVRRTGFEWQTITRVIDASDHKTLSRSLEEVPGDRAIVLGEAEAAFVHDTAVIGPTSPVLGQRLHLGIEPVAGKLSFADVRMDLRRYVMPVRPLTLAVRVEHLGRYGPGAADGRVTPLIVNLQSRVRGYDLRTFAADECGPAAETCSPLDELTGGRLALVNVEARAPLLGLLSGDLYYGTLPIEAFAFADGGFLWTRHAGAALERDRFRSVGAGARVNVGGFVFELAGVRPFDRVDKGWTVSLMLRPGW